MVYKGPIVLYTYYSILLFLGLVDDYTLYILSIYRVYIEYIYTTLFVSTSWMPNICVYALLALITLSN
jgi:hypothetical protein